MCVCVCVMIVNGLFYIAHTYYIISVNLQNTYMHALMCVTGCMATYIHIVVLLMEMFCCMHAWRISRGRSKGAKEPLICIELQSTVIYSL